MRIHLKKLIILLKMVSYFIKLEFLFKDSYVISPERYGTVDDYMEITL
jgi:hypothetical protein